MQKVVGCPLLYGQPSPKGKERELNYDLTSNNSFGCIVWGLGTSSLSFQSLNNILLSFMSLFVSSLYTGKRVVES